MENVDEQRKKVLKGIMDIIEHNHVTLEIVVKKKPTGVKIIWEVTEEYMKQMVEKSKKKEEWIMDKVFTVLVTKPGKRFPQFEMFRGKDYKEILSGLHLPSWNYKFNGYIRELEW